MNVRGRAGSGSVAKRSVSGSSMFAAAATPGVPSGTAGPARTDSAERRAWRAHLLTPGKAAPAPLVNRTHRVVRQRARTLQARRSLVRSLWLPLAVCSGLLLVVCSAIWSVLAEDEFAPAGLPDPSQQMAVLLLWCLPLSAALLAFVWFRLSATRNDEGGLP